MSVKYIIKQHYPSLPKEYAPGTILQLYTPIVGFAYYSDIYDKMRINKSEVEDNLNFFEKFNPEPNLEDFYDGSDPRGCSTSEYNEYEKALGKWKRLYN